MLRNCFLLAMCSFYTGLGYYICTTVLKGTYEFLNIPQRPVVFVYRLVSY
jgi:hypothetical protein